MSLFQDILANRPNRLLSGVPDSMISPLTVQERNGVAVWIHDQLLSPLPSVADWTLLWCGPTPLFGGPVSQLLLGQEATNIMDCCNSLDDPSQLERWSEIDPGLRFILERGDLTRYLIYDAPLALFVDRSSPQESWRFGHSAIDPNDTSPAAWRRLTSADVLNALLASWRQRRPKGRLARERLCDIAEKALSLSRQP